MLSYLAQILVFLIALMGIVFKNIETDDKGSNVIKKYGMFALTKSGLAFVIILILSLSISLIATYQGEKKAETAAKEAKEKENRLNADLANMQKQNEILVADVDALRKQNYSEFEKQTSNFISVLNTQKQSTIDTTQKIENSAGTLLSNLRSTSNLLGDRLNTSIAEINKVRLDRNLLGVEISFKPPANQWADIEQSYQKIKSPVTSSPSGSFPYSSSTMIANRADGYWNIDFKPIEDQPAGTVRFGPTATNVPAGKAFEEVILKALTELLIKWGNGLETEVSTRGSYPSSITVSQHLITFTFRNPEIRLLDLHANPTIEIRGKSEPRYVIIHSLDPDAAFNETLEVSKEESNRSHRERVMRYTSGPYRLNINSKPRVR